MSEFEQQYHRHANLDLETWKLTERLLKISATEKLDIDHEILCDNRTKCNRFLFKTLVKEWFMSRTGFDPLKA